MGGDMLLRNLVVCGFLVFAVANAIAVEIKKSDASANLNKMVVTKNVNELVNINSADVKTFLKIKGFGKKKAEAVIEYRTQNGPFKSVEDLLKVKSRGLNKKWLDKISQFLTV